MGKYHDLNSQESRELVDKIPYNWYCLTGFQRQEQSQGEEKWKIIYDLKLKHVLVCFLSCFVVSCCVLSVWGSMSSASTVVANYVAFLTSFAVCFP